jgi:O-antigen/teichoic acid export membrane protein
MHPIIRAAKKLMFTETTGKGLLALVDQSFSSLAQFLSGVIIGRNCSKEQLGLFVLGLSIIYFFKGVQSSVISSPYTVYFPRLKGIAQKYYSGSSLIHQFGLSFIAILLMSGMGIVLSLGVGPAGFSPVILALILTMIFIMLHEFIRSLLFAHLDISTAFVLDLAILIIQITGLLLLSHYGILSAQSAIWVIGIAAGFAGTTWLILNLRQFSFHKKRIIADFRINVVFGKWVLGSVLVYFISTQCYYWILAQLKSVAETGTFAACQGVVNIANPFLLGLYNVLRPKASHAFTNGGISALGSVIRKAILIISIPMFIFLFIVIVYGDELVVLIYGGKYKGTGVIVLILGLSLVVTALCYPFDFGIWAMEKPNINFWITLSAPLVVLFLGFWLVKYLGNIGAALGLLAGNTTIMILRVIAYLKLASSLARE